MTNRTRQPNLLRSRGLTLGGRVAGAIGINKRHPLGNFIAWFFFVTMILGEPVHLLVFPFMEGGRYHYFYFPGVWSALLPMPPAVFGIWRMLADERAATEMAQWRRGT
jgi:hypothetical protein